MVLASPSQGEPGRGRNGSVAGNALPGGYPRSASRPPLQRRRPADALEDLPAAPAPRHGRPLPAPAGARHPAALSRRAGPSPRRFGRPPPTLRGPLQIFLCGGGDAKLVVRRRARVKTASLGQALWLSATRCPSRPSCLFDLCQLGRQVGPVSTRHEDRFWSSHRQTGRPRVWFPSCAARADGVRADSHTPNDHMNQPPAAGGVVAGGPASSRVGRAGRPAAASKGSATQCPVGAASASRARAAGERAMSATSWAREAAPPARRAVWSERSSAPGRRAERRCEQRADEAGVVQGGQGGRGVEQVFGDFRPARAGAERGHEGREGDAVGVLAEYRAVQRSGLAPPGLRRPGRASHRRSGGGPPVRATPRRRPRQPPAARRRAGARRRSPSRPGGWSALRRGRRGRRRRGFRRRRAGGGGA